MKYFAIIPIFSLVCLSACKIPHAAPYDFPKPVDTTTRPIVLQEKRTWDAGGVHAGNRFDAARLNDFSRINDTIWQALISPENTPINMSPWYAFKIWADSLRTIRLVLHYENGHHRYPPKISHNGRVWSDLDSTLVQPFDSTGALLTLHLGPDTLWLAGQEVTPSAKVEKWARTIALHPAATFKHVGLSKQGRPLFMLDINEGPPKKKDIIVVLSRQHPPEVTGYFAMQAFIEELMADNPLANAFRRKYHLLVFPLMNPDGVDNGHWRHNAGGIFTIAEADEPGFGSIWLAGDYLCEVEFPYISHSSIEYEQTLGKVDLILEKHDPALLVPGHGEVALRRDEILQRKKEALEYIRDMRQCIAAGIPFDTEKLWQRYRFRRGMEGFQKENLALFKKEWAGRT